jgi:2-dehydro-3-deoxyphosphogluconate aldolase/(4S)-4-hydroxy-2-oxoglutarate aldolase
MPSKSEIITRVAQCGIIAVVRAQKAEHVLPLSEALVAGGVVIVEITMTTPNAIKCIEEVSRKLGARAVVGAGTVLDVATAREALAAGAQFVVSPIMRPELVAPCHAEDKPVMLGAYTPTEAQLAHEAGADFVKIFPSDGLGPNYIRAIRAPLPHLKIIPTGIATANLVPEFINAGCVAVGLGSILMTPGIMRDAHWAELTRVARGFVAMIEAARVKMGPPPLRKP